jgi:hypothetical protein
MKATNIAICGLLAFSCVQAAAAQSDAVPKKLVAFSGGTWTGFHHVELDGDTLLYWRGGPKDKESAERVKPSSERWREFRRELDSIGIWRWRSDYSTHAIADATAWSLDVEYSDRHIKTGGDGGLFPDQAGAPAPHRSAHETDQYTRYVKALQDLLGRDTFPQ